MNWPYVKQYNEKGEVTNPLFKKVSDDGIYLPNYDSKTGPTRKERRNNPKERFKGNKKGVSLTVGGKFRYHRVIQVIKGTNKRIEHYILK